MDSILKIDVMGVIMAVLVVEILKMFKVLPDMYIIKAFIMTCCPGLEARDMAWAFFLASMAP